MFTVSVLGNQASVAHRTGRAATAAAPVLRTTSSPYFYNDELYKDFQHKENRWGKALERGGVKHEMAGSHSNSEGTTCEERPKRPSR